MFIHYKMGNVKMKIKVMLGVNQLIIKLKLIKMDVQLLFWIKYTYLLSYIDYLVD